MCRTPEANKRRPIDMQVLDVIAILSAGLLAGNELAVSLFVNPAIWQLEERAQARALSILARSLGSFMPFWYFLCLILMGAEAWLRRHQPSLLWLLVAAGLWISIILYTVSTLVPINNRVAALPPDTLPEGWSRKHRTWDKLHRLRIMLLILAVTCLIIGVLASH
jgi:uncharacterized membrane protein